MTRSAMATVCSERCALRVCRRHSLNAPRRYMVFACTTALICSRRDATRARHCCHASRSAARRRASAIVAAAEWRCRRYAARSRHTRHASCSSRRRTRSARHSVRARSADCLAATARQPARALLPRRCQYMQAACSCPASSPCRQRLLVDVVLSHPVEARKQDTSRCIHRRVLQCAGSM